MKRLVSIIRAHEDVLRMNAFLANQSRDSKRWFVVQGNISGNSVDTDKHYKNIGQGGVLKYLRRKLLSPH